MQVSKNTIERQIEIADNAIMSRDYDALMSVYTDDAVLVIEPMRNAVGKEQIRNAFMKISEFFDNGLKVVQNGLEVLKAGDTALVLANTVVSGPNFQAVERKATYVFKKSNDGIWLCAIDNSYGHEIIQKQPIKNLL
jgi:uncharacterized protein (TIGR02246 family)